MMYLVNCTKEIQQFFSMLSGQVAERIMLIEAPSGCGKTSLLLRFETECPDNVKLVWVDLKAAQTGFSYIFFRIRKKLGVDCFPNFNRSLQHFMTGGAEVSGNEIYGEENQIQVILNIQDESLRNIRLVALCESFFTDIAAFPASVLLIFDTFNAAPDSLKRWIAGEFLAVVSDTQNMFVIVAGQQVPKPNGEWIRYHYHCQLDAIVEIDSWWDYTQAMGWSFNRDEVSMAIRILKGQPSELVKTFEGLAREAGI